MVFTLYLLIFLRVKRRQKLIWTLIGFVLDFGELTVGLHWIHQLHLPEARCCVPLVVKLCQRSDFDRVCTGLTVNLQWVYWIHGLHTPEARCCVCLW